MAEMAVPIPAAPLLAQQVVAHPVQEPWSESSSVFSQHWSVASPPSSLRRMFADAQILMYYFFRKYGRPAVVKPKSNEVNKWDAANNLQAMKQEAVLVTTVAEQRYVYREPAHMS